MARRRAAGRLIEPSGLGSRDLLGEALAGVLQRPGRSMLTMLGTVLGIGAFVTVLGLTATASGQIDKRFSVLSATEVTVQDVGTGDPDDNPLSFPTDADRRAGDIPGVLHAGVFWPVPAHSPRIAARPNLSTADAEPGAGLTFVAAEPAALDAMHPVLSHGRLYDGFHQQRGERVALLGAGAAARLGITRLDAQPAVFVDDTPYAVIGIIGNLQRHAELLLAVVIPTSTALDGYGPPTDQRPTMLIDTRLGAGQTVAGRVAPTLRPEAPDLFKVTAPADPKNLRGAVTHDLNSLFLLLAGISLVVGAVGIANTTLVAVLERTSEIGLRRSLGARPRDIAAQFLTESTALGVLGGLIGTSLGVAAVVGVALSRQWTAVLEPWTVLPAPLAGGLVGLLAGLYPALRAAWVEPVEALRR